MFSPDEVNVNPYPEIGQRLREERRRLGMNQSAFAKATGIHLNTQSRYEKGDRWPDTTYLVAAATAGADVAFILTGQRAPDAQADRQGLLHVLEIVAVTLDIARGEIGRDFDAAVVAAVEAYKSAWSDEAASASADQAFEAVLRRSPLWLADARQLETVLEKVEFVLDAQGWKLSPVDKSRAIVSLLREERRSGRSADLTAVQKALQEPAGIAR